MTPEETVRRMQVQHARILAATSEAVRRVWLGLGSYDAADVPRFIAKVQPIVERAAAQIAALVDTTSAQLAGTRPIGIALAPRRDPYRARLEPRRDSYPGATRTHARPAAGHGRSVRSTVELTRRKESPNEQHVGICVNPQSDPGERRGPGRTAGRGQA